jgi:hypothetical protein
MKRPHVGSQVSVELDDPGPLPNDPGVARNHTWPYQDAIDACGGMRVRDSGPNAPAPVAKIRTCEACGRPLVDADDSVRAASNPAAGTPLPYDNSPRKR